MALDREPLAAINDNSVNAAPGRPGKGKEPNRKGVRNVGQKEQRIDGPEFHPADPNLGQTVFNTMKALGAVASCFADPDTDVLPKGEKRRSHKGVAEDSLVDILNKQGGYDKRLDAALGDNDDEDGAGPDGQFEDQEFGAYEGVNFAALKTAQEAPTEIKCYKHDDSSSSSCSDEVMQQQPPAHATAATSIDKVSIATTAARTATTHASKAPAAATAAPKATRAVAPPANNKSAALSAAVEKSKTSATPASIAATPKPMPTTSSSTPADASAASKQRALLPSINNNPGRKDASTSKAGSKASAAVAAAVAVVTAANGAGTSTSAAAAALLRKGVAGTGAGVASVAAGTAAGGAAKAAPVKFFQSQPQAGPLKHLPAPLKPRGPIEALRLAQDGAKQATPATATAATARHGPAAAAATATQKPPSAHVSSTTAAVQQPQTNKPNTLTSVPGKTIDTTDDGPPGIQKATQKDAEKACDEGADKAGAGGAAAPVPKRRGRPPASSKATQAGAPQTVSDAAKAKQITATGSKKETVIQPENKTTQMASKATLIGNQDSTGRQSAGQVKQSNKQGTEKIYLDTSPSVASGQTSQVSQRSLRSRCNGNPDTQDDAATPGPGTAKKRAATQSRAAGCRGLALDDKHEKLGDNKGESMESPEEDGSAVEQPADDPEQTISQQQASAAPRAGGGAKRGPRPGADKAGGGGGATRARACKRAKLPSVAEDDEEGVDKDDDADDGVEGSGNVIVATDDTSPAQTDERICDRGREARAPAAAGRKRKSASPVDEPTNVQQSAQDRTSPCQRRATAGAKKVHSGQSSPTEQTAARAAGPEVQNKGRARRAATRLVTYQEPDSDLDHADADGASDYSDEDNGRETDDGNGKAKPGRGARSSKGTSQPAPAPVKPSPKRRRKSPDVKPAQQPHALHADTSPNNVVEDEDEGAAGASQPGSTQEEEGKHQADDQARDVAAAYKVGKTSARGGRGRANTAGNKAQRSTRQRKDVDDVAGQDAGSPDNAAAADNVLSKAGAQKESEQRSEHAELETVQEENRVLQVQLTQQERTVSDLQAEKEALIRELQEEREARKDLQTKLQDAVRVRDDAVQALKATQAALMGISL